jgi:hypothetical protein
MIIPYAMGFGCCHLSSTSFLLGAKSLCWHVYKKSVLVIDGKNNSNDGMSIGKNNNNDSMLTVIDGKNNNDEGMATGKNSSDVGRFTIGRQQWKIGRQKAEYLFVIDGKLSPTMTNKRKWQDQQRNEDRMARSECAAMEKQEQRKLRRISAESHAVRRCAPGMRLTHCQSSREIAYSGS